MVNHICDTITLRQYTGHASEGMLDMMLRRLQSTSHDGGCINIAHTGHSNANIGNTACERLQPLARLAGLTGMEAEHSNICGRRLLFADVVVTNGAEVTELALDAPFWRLCN
uniref:Uncharacterized protein n=1 Tax=Anopheles coluzzii TaxID=1518534 RepID=A0A8W7PLR1_ANOCL